MGSSPTPGAGCGKCTSSELHGTCSSHSGVGARINSPARWGLDRQLRAPLLAYPPGVRVTLLHTLAAEPEARAEAIRQLYEDPESREMAELLIDLEEDRRVQADVMEALSESLTD